LKELAIRKLSIAISRISHLVGLLCYLLDSYGIDETSMNSANRNFLL